MKNPIQVMFESGVVEQTDFPPESRYHGVPVVTILGPDGTEIAYLRRRFVPPPGAFATLRERVVAQGERLDHIAAAEIGDPEAFWQLCDANGVIWPQVLEQTGRRLQITLPEGVPAAEET